MASNSDHKDTVVWVTYSKNCKESDIKRHLTSKFPTKHRFIRKGDNNAVILFGNPTDADEYIKGEKISPHKIKCDTAIGETKAIFTSVVIDLVKKHNTTICDTGVELRNLGKKVKQPAFAKGTIRQLQKVEDILRKKQKVSPNVPEVVPGSDNKVFEHFKATVHPWAAHSLTRDQTDIIEKKVKGNVNIDYGTNGYVIETTKLEALIETEKLLYSNSVDNGVTCSNEQDQRRKPTKGDAVEKKIGATRRKHENGFSCTEGSNTGASKKRTVKPASDMTGLNKHSKPGLPTHSHSPPIYTKSTSINKKTDVKKRGKSNNATKKDEIDVMVCLEKMHLSYITEEGLQISIYTGDITEQKSDIIVNASNTKLKHVGGVALAIAKAGGRAIKQECDAYIRKYGDLQTGKYIKTSGGNLRCKHVIHAVGPIWNADDMGDQRHCIDLLYNLLLDIFKYSSFLRAKSLATPAISGGIYGMPLETCAKVFHQAVNEYSAKHSGKASLKEITILNLHDDATATFILEFGGAFTGQSPTMSKLSSDASSSSLSPSRPLPAKRPVFSGDGCVRDHETYDGAMETTPPISGSHAASNASPKDISPANSLTEIAIDARNKGDCEICAENDVSLKAMNCCQSTICTECFAHHFGNHGKCPFCSLIVLLKRGNQPKGSMKSEIDDESHLPGYDRKGTITIEYYFPGGKQGKNHPNPGQNYSGTSRRAYLPADRDGKEILELLERAFDNGLLFTIGKSVTTGMDNCVVWNDVHHKTSRTGGSASHGYPDPTYLFRVREELAAKGIK
ncbi:uncharacterized protein LOC100370943 [Saccoglossus kowalevskii]|uniref:E3 ubiquitin-protein ligase n=1 Tax=Saccoglossus kowalevskii TaxID=10224 RepID=A0ABM0GM05_SACKO|nr:PREDICTED: uncharacterized protein LOC100370943 [Saccoglossus kowalevskii]